MGLPLLSIDPLNNWNLGINNDFIRNKMETDKWLFKIRKITEGVFKIKTEKNPLQSVEDHRFLDDLSAEIYPQR